VSDAEVGDDRLALGQQDVLRFDVPVHHALAMGIIERYGHLLRHAERVVQWQLPLAREAPPERFSGDIWHHVIQEAARFS
jgi:hypothetical protein